MSHNYTHLNIGGFNATTHGSYSNISPVMIGNCLAIGINGNGQMVFATSHTPSGQNFASNAEFTAALKRASTNCNY
jgi:hypothetical protein